MSRKKIILRRFSGGILFGYLAPAGFVQGDALELLDLGGRVVTVPLGEVKMASFVRDFNTADLLNPERLSRKTFVARPRTEGLWLRCTLRDDDVLEGLAPLDLSFAEGFTEDRGVQLIPPDVRGNVQRIYVPRVAMKQMDVVSVITSPSKKKGLLQIAASEEQPDLFAALGPDAPLH
jgi:hypothetical protein